MSDSSSLHASTEADISTSGGTKDSVNLPLAIALPVSLFVFLVFVVVLVICAIKYKSWFQKRGRSVRGSVEGSSDLGDNNNDLDAVNPHMKGTTLDLASRIPLSSDQPVISGCTATSSEIQIPSESGMPSVCAQNGDQISLDSATGVVSVEESSVPAEIGRDTSDDIAMETANLAQPCSSADEKRGSEVEGKFQTCQVTHPYQAVESDLELNDVILAREGDEENSGWLCGSMKRSSEAGWFPMSHVVHTHDEKLPECSRSEIQDSAQTVEDFGADVGGFECRALFPFSGAEGRDLTFNPGDIITTLKTQESGWWYGCSGENVGWFPASYVDVLPRVRSLASAVQIVSPSAVQTVSSLDRAANCTGSTADRPALDAKEHTFSASTDQDILDRIKLKQKDHDSNSTRVSSGSALITEDNASDSHRARNPVHKQSNSGSEQSVEELPLPVTYNTTNSLSDSSHLMVSNGVHKAELSNSIALEKPMVPSGKPSLVRRLDLLRLKKSSKRDKLEKHDASNDVTLEEKNHAPSQVLHGNSKILDDDERQKSLEDSFYALSEGPSLSLRNSFRNKSQIPVGQPHLVSDAVTERTLPSSASQKLLMCKFGPPAGITQVNLESSDLTEGKFTYHASFIDHGSDTIGSSVSRDLSFSEAEKTESQWDMVLGKFDKILDSTWTSDSNSISDVSMHRSSLCNDMSNTSDGIDYGILLAVDNYSVSDGKKRNELSGRKHWRTTDVEVCGESAKGEFNTKSILCNKTENMASSEVDLLPFAPVGFNDDRNEDLSSKFLDYFSRGVGRVDSDGLKDIRSSPIPTIKDSMIPQSEVKRTYPAGVKTLAPKPQLRHPIAKRGDQTIPSSIKVMSKDDADDNNMSKDERRLEIERRLQKEADGTDDGTLTFVLGEREPRRSRVSTLLIPDVVRGYITLDDFNSNLIPPPFGFSNDPDNAGWKELKSFKEVEYKASAESSNTEVAEFDEIQVPRYFNRMSYSPHVNGYVGTLPSSDQASQQAFTETVSDIVDRGAEVEIASWKPWSHSELETSKYGLPPGFEDEPTDFSTGYSHSIMFPLADGSVVLDEADVGLESVI